MSWVGIGVSVAGAAIKAGGDYYGAKGAADAYGNIPYLETDVAGDILKYTQGLGQSLPNIHGVEAQWRPEFQNLNNRDIGTMLFGYRGDPGYIDLTSQAIGRGIGQVQDARDAEIAYRRNRSGDVNEMLRGISPEATAALDRQSEFAAERHQSAKGLTAEEAQNAEQQAREAMAARGRINDNAAVSAEILGREDALRRKRAEAQQANAGAYQMGRESRAQALNILSETPGGVQMGQNYGRMGLNSVGAGVPQLVDVGTALNIGAVDRANMLDYFQTLAESKARSKGGLISGIGGMVKSLVGGF